MTSPPPRSIDSLSVISLRVEARANGRALSLATGFCVEAGARRFLITNWHVVTGRHPDTEQAMHSSLAVPDSIAILHHISGQLGAWLVREEPLYTETGGARWVEHSRGRHVDVVALPITSQDATTQFYPLDLNLARADVIVQVAMAASIIGFPLGHSISGAFPIWKTGHIATDPDLDYDDRPCFIIDATTREGMSGFPVFLRQYGGHSSSTAAIVLGAGPATRFLGVYSGRLHGDAELGLVWKPSALDDLLSRADV